MHPRAESPLQTRIAEVVMSALFPCDLGDGIEVVHDVEVLEIEMVCDLDDDSWYSAPYERIEIQLDPAAVAPAIEDLSSRERIAALSMLDTVERSAVWDTLPFAPYDPIVTGEIVTGGAPPTFADTTPYARCEPDTIPFVRYYVRRAGR
jgi:hypothetical protein